MARRRGQQKGHVHRQGNWWYVAYREDALNGEGEIVRVRRNQKLADAREVSKREAQRLAREILATVDAQAQQPSSFMTVAEFVEGRFVPDVIWALKPAGKKHYGYFLRCHVLPALGPMRLRNVTSDHVQRLVKQKIEADYSVQTATHIRNVISAVFNHARSRRAYVGDNPVEGVRLPESDRKEARSLSFEQARCLLEALPSPVREMALLSITTSMNVAELLGLRRKRVNLTSAPTLVGTVNVPPYHLAVLENYYRGDFGTPKAKSRKRILPISPLVAAVLKQFMDRSPFQGPEDLVFVSSKGTPLNENNLRKRVLKPVASQLGIPWVTWHTFRHTHATLGDQIGMSLADRQAQLGHSDIRMTLHYTHSDLERRQRSIEKMTELLLGRSSGRVN